jgi:hypothetical protein
MLKTRRQEYANPAAGTNRLIVGMAMPKVGRIRLVAALSFQRSVFSIGWSANKKACQAIGRLARKIGAQIIQV